MKTIGSLFTLVVLGSSLFATNSFAEETVSLRSRSMNAVSTSSHAASASATVSNSGRYIAPAQTATTNKDAYGGYGAYGYNPYLSGNGYGY